MAKRLVLLLSFAGTLAVALPPAWGSRQAGSACAHGAAAQCQDLQERTADELFQVYTSLDPSEKRARAEASLAFMRIKTEGNTVTQLLLRNVAA